MRVKLYSPPVTLTVTNLSPHITVSKFSVPTPFYFFGLFYFHGDSYLKSLNFFFKVYRVLGSVWLLGNV